MMKSTLLGSLRTTGFAEGVSYLLLLAICMPLKYIFHIPQPTFFVGMAHGLLFVAYCILVLVVAWKSKWTWATTFWALVASLLPFGTFVADKRIFRVSQSAN